MAEAPVAERSARPGAVDDLGVADMKIGRFDYKWVALAVVLCGTIMTILDSTIVNIAIPTLQHDLHAGSYTDIAWVVTGYLLAQGAVIPLTGWATDRWGTKRLYLITIVMFTVASMLCGVSQNLGELIFFRVIHGIVGCVAATRFLRETHRTAGLRLDVLGLLTGVPAVLALMYAVDRSTDLGWSSALVISLLLASALLMVAFVLRQLRAREPLLQLSLFRDRTFSWAMVLSFVVVTAMFRTMLL